MESVSAYIRVTREPLPWLCSPPHEDETGQEEKMESATRPWIFWLLDLGCSASRAVRLLISPWSMVFCHNGPRDSDTAKMAEGSLVKGQQ